MKSTLLVAVRYACFSACVLVFMLPALVSAQISLCDKNDYDCQISFYSDVLEIKPDDAESYFNRGLAYGRQGNYDQAIVDFDKAIRMDPYDAATYRNRGLAYLKKGNSEQAIADYNSAIELN